MAFILIGWYEWYSVYKWFAHLRKISLFNRFSSTPFNFYTCHIGGIQLSGLTSVKKSVPQYKCEVFPGIIQIIPIVGFDWKYSNKWIFQHNILRSTFKYMNKAYIFRIWARMALCCMYFPIFTKRNIRNLLLHSFKERFNNNFLCWCWMLNVEWRLSIFKHSN